MRFDVLTLFPEMFPGPLGTSILKRAMQAGLLGVRLHNFRAYAYDRHHTVDDYPYGGGAGMVLKPAPLFAAVAAVRALAPPPPGLRLYTPDGPETVFVDGPASAEPPPGNDSAAAASNEQEDDLPIVLLSPQGRVFTQAIAAELATVPRLILLCGHYEGVDERVREHLVTHELSIGDYVLTGGEIPAMVVIDAVARLVPGVLGEGSAGEESHTSGLLEYPQYTRPADFQGWRVPDMLVSGHHAQVAAWRRREALRRTLLRRPDLLAQAPLTPQDRRWLAELRQEIAERGPQMEESC
jgi:tRNA (guanine37-N1)-methyltransferase